MENFNTKKDIKSFDFQGGEFYSDKINLVITEIGLKMKILYLVHVEEIDEAALKTISRHCPHLSTLGFYNCEFQERPAEDPETALYFPSQPGEKDEMELLLELTGLAVVSECPARYAVLLLGSALNVHQFKTGINVHLSDSDINTVFENNQMKELVSWNMPASKFLTMESVNMLISTCDNLK